METNKNKCILASKCSIAGSNRCNNMCHPFIALHSDSGRLANANIPIEYSTITLSNSIIQTLEVTVKSKNVEKVVPILPRLNLYVTTFERLYKHLGIRVNPSELTKSLYLYSANTGTGKTTTACALLNEWISYSYVAHVSDGKQPPELMGYFLDLNDLQTLYNKFNRPMIPASVAEPSAKEYYKRLELAQRSPFLVIDDIGVRSSKEGFYGDIHSLINGRVVSQLPTVYTSNVRISELEGIYDKRLMDRVRDLCTTFHYHGESKRGKR